MSRAPIDRTPIGRRSFIALAAAAPALAPMRRARAAAPPGIALGFIGTGAHGRELMAEGAGAIAALCDVDARALARAAALARPGVRLHRDARALLAQSGLEGVAIATPDHHHARLAIAACEAGLPVFVAAPACWRPAEAAALQAAAARTGVAVHAGNPLRSAPAVAAALAAVHAGALGSIEAVEIAAPPNPQGGDAAAAHAPPADLDWAAWCGPALPLPYHPDCTGAGYRWVHALGGGRIGLEGALAFEIALEALGIAGPAVASIEAGGAPPAPGLLWDCPPALEAAYRFEGAGATLHWRQAADTAGPSLTFRGERGAIVVRGLDGTPALEAPPEITVPQAAAPERPLARWAAAAAAGAPDAAGLAQACRAAQLAQLGNLAYGLGRALSWREAEGRIDGDPLGGRWLSEPGWTAEAPAP